MKAANTHIYFLGIGGIGMSALARYYKNLGYEVAGYDLTPSALTRQLENEGMHIHYHEEVSKIPPQTQWVVYTPAIPADNKELVYCLKNFTTIKRAELLGNLSREHNTIAVAGTHGKTSISALVTHLLKNAGKEITAFVGGITNNYKSNLILSPTTDIFVVEADEFDRSFLRLHPQIAIVSSMDADHLDIYQNHDALKSTFLEFASQVDPKGLLIYHHTLEKYFNKIPNKVSYGAYPEAGFSAKDICVQDHRFTFTIKTPEIEITDLWLQVPGLHYIENALAAVAAVSQYGLTPDEIKEGLSTFSGVERRFEIRKTTGSKVFIDDYAHHPEEIRVTIEAVKRLYPEKRILGLFQPHLYSRTRDFADDFAKVLQTLDIVALLPIYPAREKPMEGVSSELLLTKMKHPAKFLVSKENLESFILSQNFDILLTMGAGDIGLMVAQIEKILALC